MSRDSVTLTRARDTITLCRSTYDSSALTVTQWCDYTPSRCPWRNHHVGDLVMQSRDAALSHDHDCVAASKTWRGVKSISAVMITSTNPPATFFFFIITMTANEIKGNKARQPMACRQRRWAANQLRLCFLQWAFYSIIFIVDFFVLHTRIFTGQFFQHFYFLVSVHLC